MRPTIKALQGQLVEVYFGFLRMDHVTSSYAGILKEIDTWFKHMCEKVLALAQVVGVTFIKRNNIAQLCVIENPLLFPHSLPKTLLHPGSTNTKYSYYITSLPSLVGNVCQ